MTCTNSKLVTGPKLKAVFLLYRYNPHLKGKDRALRDREIKATLKYRLKNLYAALIRVWVSKFPYS